MNYIYSSAFFVMKQRWRLQFVEKLAAFIIILATIKKTLRLAYVEFTSIRRRASEVT